jgi:predicted acylesterase/phospholipase RssA
MSASTPPLPVAIVLSGTAPAMTLMSGVMIAFAERGLQFRVISTTGIGALVGMLYLAPSSGTPAEALRQIPNLFVSDWLYTLFPVNFKMFFKNGPLAQRFYELRREIPKIPVEPDESRHVSRLINDSLQLAATALTPPSLDSFRKGLMGHVSLVEDLVDFAKLAASPTKFYVNAFSMYRRRLRMFDNDKEHDPHGVDTAVYNGAQALFSLFEPVRIPGDLLTTGATHDPTALQAIWTHHRTTGLETVIALDFVARAFWREPEDVYDAFQLMLMNPVAAAHDLMLALYDALSDRLSELDATSRDALGGQLPPLSFVPFDVKESYYPSMPKWTHDNAVTLQKIGYDTARPVADLLQRQDWATLRTRYRYPIVMRREGPRARQFLRLFEPLVQRRTFGPFVEELLRRRRRRAEESQAT